MTKVSLIAFAGVAAVVIGGFAYLYHSRDTIPASAPVPEAPPMIDVAVVKSKAEQGDARAQAQLAKAYATGNGAKLDYKQAAHWYGRAATNNNADGEAGLGELYQAGQGVKKDLALAAQWFRRAADAGNVAGQFDLAFLYEQGMGVPQDEAAAAKWYRLASEGGDPQAQFDYGQRCLLGVGTAKDPVEGLKWFLVAAGNGQPDAAGNLAATRKEMTSEQIAEAKERAAAFIPRTAAL